LVCRHSFGWAREIRKRQGAGAHREGKWPLPPCNITFLHNKSHLSVPRGAHIPLRVAASSTESSSISCFFGSFPGQRAVLSIPCLETRSLKHQERKGRNEHFLSAQSAQGISFICCCPQSLSCVQLFGTPWTIAHQALSCNFPGKNTGAGCHFLLQEIFPTQGLNLHLLNLLHCRWILYHCTTWEVPFIHVVKINSPNMTLSPSRCRLSSERFWDSPEMIQVVMTEMLLDHKSEILKDIFAPLILGFSCQGGYGGSQTVTHFLFLGSRITAYVDCSQEIKRRLLLGRKAMTSLDSVLKSRDTTLSTKVRIVKAMVFPVAMYGFESWTIRKVEH